MTLEEAKIILINRGFVEINGDMVFDGNKWRNSIAVISKWLEQQPCEDCISRQAIKRKLQERHDFFIHAYNGFSNMPQNDKSRVDEINNCIAMIVNEPSVTPKEKTGRWTLLLDNDGSPTLEETYGKVYRCSVCSFISYGENFCGNCGTKMQEVSE